MEQKRTRLRNLSLQTVVSHPSCRARMPAGGICPSSPKVWLGLFESIRKTHMRQRIQRYSFPIWPIPNSVPERHTGSRLPVGCIELIMHGGRHGIDPITVTESEYYMVMIVPVHRIYIQAYLLFATGFIGYTFKFSAV
jgi:hypothetical protein